jgi:hypothetical protein
MHPLAPDVSALSTDELTAKYTQLSKRLNQSQRMGPQSIIPQIQLMMQVYHAELGRRNDKLMAEMEEKMDSGKGYQGIIDIS